MEMMMTRAVPAPAIRSLHYQVNHPNTLLPSPFLSSPSPHSPFKKLPAPLRASHHQLLYRQLHVRPVSALEDTSPTAQVMQLDQAFEVKKRAAEISDGLKGTSIFLVGMKSNIKTSMGKVLADAFRYYYFDSDELVEAAAGAGADCRTFKERDPEGFRESETEVLKQLSSMGRLVVAAGDGAVQSSTNLALLRYGISICIEVPIDMLANNTMESLGGSAFEMDRDQLISQLIVQYNENKSGYSNSDVTVSLQRVASQLGYDDVELVLEEDLALEVIKEIGKLMRVKKLLEEAAKPF